MHRAVRPALFYGLATLLLPCVSASFGFTSGSFDYVRLMSPQSISWNGQSGQVELRLMKYPADAVLSYLPIAANLTATSYTWLPVSLAPASQWTLEGIDGAGNIATSGNPFTVQGTAAAASPGSASPSLLQQNPAQTASPTSNSPTAPTTTPEPSSADSSNSPSDQTTSTGSKVGLTIGVISALTAIIGLVFFFVLLRRRRKQQGRSASWNPFRTKKRPDSPLPFELEGNESVDTLHKPMELQGSDVAGTSETSYGRRVELGWGHNRKESRGKRLTLAEGAVETSMGKRMELG